MDIYIYVAKKNFIVFEILCGYIHMYYVYMCDKKT